MKKAVDAFRSIGEVSQLVGVAPHVLRYWEAQFPLFSPVKRRDGRRYYRPDDVKLAAGLCEVLREDGVSIRGAKKLMAADRGAALRMRGAARLSQLFGDEPAEIESVAAEAPASAEPADRPRRRKQPADRGTLPLFAHLDAPPASTPEQAKPTPAANWLIRLQNLNAALRDLPPEPATLAGAAAILADLREARQAIST
ncbi:MerR family transcriptional regulator [Paracoccus xiamenensis]|uniref:MerR family transcriptional regulator n=1 Tax=Paracoccus xiamenensis TaxID=2714901 RepID=UPI0014096323|nr:MerR family transcriptional regulator [Paracoccus xiamenensis]NHF72823.1 MerR family transcriptional regulator [Paracoccus xiamenensis]